MRHLVVSLSMFLLICCATAESSNAPTDNPRLTQLHDEDQSDRVAWKAKQLSSPAILERDEKRREEVRQLLAKGQVVTAHDFFCAALIFHHGQTAEHYRMAASLAWIGMTIEPTNKDYAYLTASTWDRLMMKQGKLQWYGTKCIYQDGKPVSLPPVEPGAVTDDDRARFDLKPLQAIQDNVGKSIRLSGANSTC
jgi:hypothetical protein